MSPLDAVHEQHRQAQKHAHETLQSTQAQMHSQHQADLKNLHSAHQQELKQLQQKHTLHHGQVTENYGMMPTGHIDAVANLVGASQQREMNDMQGRHENESKALHNAHFNEHLRNYVQRNSTT